MSLGKTLLSQKRWNFSNNKNNIKEKHLKYTSTHDVDGVSITKKKPSPKTDVSRLNIDGDPFGEHKNSRDIRDNFTRLFNNEVNNNISMSEQEAKDWHKRTKVFGLSYGWSTPLERPNTKKGGVFWSMKTYPNDPIISNAVNACLTQYSNGGLILSRRYWNQFCNRSMVDKGLLRDTTEVLRERGLI